MNIDKEELFNKKIISFVNHINATMLNDFIEELYHLTKIKHGINMEFPEIEDIFNETQLELKFQYNENNTIIEEEWFFDKIQRILYLKEKKEKPYNYEYSKINIIFEKNQTKTDLMTIVSNIFSLTVFIDTEKTYFSFRDENEINQILNNLLRISKLEQLEI